MLDRDLIDVAYDVFGGYVSAMPPSNCPPGASPSCQDISFPGVGFCSRGGLGVFPFSGAAIPSNAGVNGMESYITSTLAKLLMIWDSLGNLYYENPQGTLNVLAQSGSPGIFMNAATAFGRKYMAFGGNAGGVDFPRQFDGTNYDRVSQFGPGGGMSVGNSPATENITGISQYAGNVTNIYQIGNEIYINVGTSAQVGNSSSPTYAQLCGTPVTINGINQTALITIAGNTVSAYNGTFYVTGAFLNSDGTWTLTTTIPTTGNAEGTGGTFSTSLTTVTAAAVPYPPVPGNSVYIAGCSVTAYNSPTRPGWPIVYGNGVNEPFQIIIGTDGNAAGSNGTVSTTAAISAGLHNLAVCWVTRQGYISKPCPWVSYIAEGGYLARCTIPTGPSNVVARLIIATPAIQAPATTGTFYSVPNGTVATGGYSSAMLISDNTTTSIDLSFSDTELIASFAAEYLYSQIVIGECYGVALYNYRLSWIGEANYLNGLLNLDFGGGWAIGGGGNGDLPLGWNASVPGGSGNTNGNRLANGGIWLDAFRFDLNNGVNSGISQSTTNQVGVQQVSANTAYSVRIRARSSNGKTVTVGLYSPSTGFISEATTPALTASYAVYTLNFNLPTPAAVPADLVFFMIGGNATGTTDVDSLFPYPTLTPFNSSTARFSYAFNPESFDSTTGQVQVTPGDGWQMRGQFAIRGNFYIGKDHYLSYTTDDGQNEPSSWDVTEVSKTVGMTGPNAVDVFEEWAMFTDRSGAYACWGSDPIKLTPEIQIDASKTGKVSWASINWDAGYTIFVRIDRQLKRALIGTPIGAATTPTLVWLFDYQFCANAEDFADSPWGGVAYSSFTGKLLYHGRGRRWVPWNIQANSMCFAERADGTAQPFFGNGVGNGLVYWQQDPPTNTSDNGVAINASYSSSYVPDAQTEQAFQLGAHRKLLGYIKWLARGAGYMNMWVTTAARTTTLRVYPLSLTPPDDSGRPINMHATRFQFSVSCDTAGYWMQFEKLIFCMRKDASILVRGSNQ